MLLGLIGGALGVALASLCTRAIVTMFPPTIFNLSIPHIEQISIDGWVLGFALAVSLFTGVLFGLVPALNACVNTNAWMKEPCRGLSGRVPGGRYTRAEVGGEVAVMLVFV